MWVFESAKHDDFAYFMMVAGCPEVVDHVFHWSLREDGVDLTVEDRPHVAGVDVEVVYLLQHHPVVLNCVRHDLHVWMLLYRSLCLSAECVTWP
jgi:hypothetical protein